MDKITVFIILSLALTFVFGFFLFRIFDKIEHKLLSNYDKKTKVIIHSILFLLVFWGLKWAGTH
jgi:phosphatidylglycerophosphatase A